VAQVTAEEESVQVDAYLDHLLAGRFAGPRVLPPTEAVDRDLELTAGLVQRALARFHPSFAFEERLAARLRHEGTGTAREEGDVPPADIPAADVLDFPVAVLPAERRARARLPGGSIPAGVSIAGVSIAGVSIAGVSIAGVSIAGAAYLVRRRGRPHGEARRRRPSVHVVA
jgi:hypothetical protein